MPVASWSIGRSRINVEAADATFSPTLPQAFAKHQRLSHLQRGQHLREYPRFIVVVGFDNLVHDTNIPNVHT